MCKDETTIGTDYANCVGHDAFRHAGLGKTGADIYFALKSRGRSNVGELARVTGRSLATVRRKLLSMEDLRMVKHCELGTWEVAEVDLDSVAKALQVSGRGERDRTRHAQDRRLQRLVSLTHRVASE